MILLEEGCGERYHQKWEGGIEAGVARKTNSLFQQAGAVKDESMMLASESRGALKVDVDGDSNEHAGGFPYHLWAERELVGQS